MGLLNIIIFFFDPLGIMRKLFFRPALNLTSNIYDQFRTKTNNGVLTIKELSLRLFIVSFAVALIIWSAVFLYVAFYYAYMPAMSHIRPVHMQFKTCLDTSGPCTFPHAHVALTKRQQLLMVGQAYKVSIEIDMPESPQNQELGMFMVCAEMRDIESLLRGHSCRSAMLRYRSPLIRTLTTWALSPLFVLGLREEFQKVPVVIFSRYLEERQHPITDVYVEIQSHKIQFYTVTLHISADFTGLRYVIFNFPAMSALVGISSNLFFIMIVFILSWYHWSDTTWVKNLQAKYMRLSRLSMSNRSLRQRVKGKDSFESPALSDKSIVDDDDISYFDENPISDSEEIVELSSSLAPITTDDTSKPQKSLQKRRKEKESLLNS
ncbi:seipin [Eupeodes corollae]|uniref:seipin n=1 Tax=Eupeodes corollae TaxID=290404 RepID=UPI0024914F3C|nr:seipin [Eupeodes corollae]